MAIYHLSVKTISRSTGRSATGAAAYRAGVEITDERTGLVHDYTRRRGVESAELILPAGAPEWAADRAKIWNAAEQAETRRNSTVAREFEIALPEELSPAERARLARDFARELVERHSCAVDVCIHAPGKGGDNRNYHAHILLSTRRLGHEGFSAKTRELDDQKTGPQIVTEWRARWAALVNERLREAGIDARVDHRSLDAQGIDREPTRHLGPAATGYERRTGKKSHRRQDIEAEALEASKVIEEIKEVSEGLIVAGKEAARTRLEVKRLNDELASVVDELDELKVLRSRKSQSEKSQSNSLLKSYEDYKQCLRSRPKLPTRPPEMIIEGDWSEPVRARSLPAYQAAVIGNAVWYLRAPVQAIEPEPDFVDRGASIDVYASDDDALVASMRLASLKWGSFRINGGSDEFRARCARLAAEHGFNIADLDLDEAPRRGPRGPGPGM